MDDRDFFRDCLKHEDVLFTNRGNFFLLAESFLFAGLIALTASNCITSRSLLAIPLLFLGCLISIIWGYSGVKQIYSTEKLIKDELRAVDRRWKYLSEARSGWYFNIHDLIGIGLPLAFLIAWAYLCCVIFLIGQC